MNGNCVEGLTFIHFELNNEALVGLKIVKTKNKVTKEKKKWPKKKQAEWDLSHSVKFVCF